MKKLYAVLLAAAMLLSMLAFTACTNDGEDETDPVTNPTTDPVTDPVTDSATEIETVAPETDPPVEENTYPYTGEVTPASVTAGWGAPTEEAVYLPVDAANVIHDGKGTWQNTMSCIASAAFDLDPATYYDCDEKCEYENGDDVAYGIADNWTAEQTGYVGAWFENGVYLTQLRWYPRSGNEARAEGCVFQISVDGKNWIDIYTIDYQPETADCQFVDIDDDYAETIYYYVRYLSRDHETYPDYAYCNIAEIEVWGTSANKPNRNIAADAEVDAPFCSSWESVAALNDGFTFEFTYGSWEDNANIHYGSWGTTAENTETITYTWSSEVTVDGIGIQTWNDQLDRVSWLSSGGVHSPAYYTIQYLDANGEYVDVANAEGLGVEPDVVNVTSFDAVTTTSIQLTLYKLTEEELADLGEPNTSLGLGIYEFEVYKAK